MYQAQFRELLFSEFKDIYPQYFYYLKSHFILFFTLENIFIKFIAVTLINNICFKCITQ